MKITIQRTRAVGLSLMVSLLLGGCTTLATGTDLHEAASLAPDAPASPDVPAVTGDWLRLNVQFYDVQGNLLFSTKAADMEEMRRVQETLGIWYEVPDITEDAPLRYQLTTNVTPVAMSNTSSVLLGGAFDGKGLGFQAAFPVLGTYKTWEEDITLSRERGPFPLEMDVDLATFDMLTKEPDGTIVFDDALRAQVEAIDDDSATLRFQVVEGAALDIVATGFTGTTWVDEETDTFGFTLDTIAGHTFTLDKACEFARYTLPIGTYRVVDVDASEIVLERSPTRWPQLVGRELIMITEITEIYQE